MTPRRHVIPVFVPHLGCPNDCVFCNQRRISGALQPATPETVRRAVESAAFLKDDGAPKQLAFYGGSFTAIPVPEQEALLGAAQDFIKSYKGAGIRVSTRPDAVDRAALERLKRYGVVTVELGAQSMDEGVLLASGRGHTARDTEKASRLVRDMGFELILQMMTGLPGDTPATAVKTAESIIALKPGGVRIYPAVVLRDTALWDMWRRGEYREHTVEDAVRLCAELVPLFESAGVPIVRLGLNPTDELSGGAAAAGAYHPALGELVYARVYLNRARALLRGRGAVARVTLGVAPSRVSVMTGQRRGNIAALRTEFGIADVRVAGAEVAPGEIVILSIENTPQTGV
ncbi:Radical_SAM C-terminal domain-containing protein [Sporobacter termitidis DSM 10068]|uniref:Radical_SAM C-terminal domain-containing protein n=1 Tax=Sporobacter termitidis DSM 10068 TaxID=1123282 RepID=A0A1M5UKR5_9FIRM|nr:radical SAM protein [Sporobacter termitidis]SHH63557.1 Radical_SAM C-terminal domain-containing protein [Sporobacter termitidis DSM 10068]